jgi:MFS family permease
VSAIVYAAAAWITRGVRYRQQSRKFVASQVPRDLAEGIAFARGHIAIAGVLAVTVAMNLLAFPYSALVAPIGRQVFQVSPTLVGVLAASEAFGGFIGGIWLTGGETRLSGRVLMVGGSLIFISCAFLMPLAPAFALACGLLAAGGFGSAAFGNMQTSLIVQHAPAHIRSRLMGLLTVCIGMGPLGILLVGYLADRVGPMLAIDIVEAVCFVWVVWIGLRWRRRERVG